MIPIDTRVMVVAHLGTGGFSKPKERCIGHTGRIARYNGSSGFYLAIEFDDSKLSSESKRWLWRDEEVIVLDADNLDFVR